MIKLLLTLSASAAALAMPAQAQTIAITGGKLVIGNGGAPIEGGTVVLRDGKVVAAGAGVAVPADAQIVDATGRWVTPGLFAGFSRLGLIEVEAVTETNDSSASTGDFSAAIDVTTAINPRATPIAVNRAAGITRAVVAPATPRSVFAGFGALIDLGEDYEAVTRARAFQFVELGETGSARAGGSRASAFLEFRNGLIEAQNLARGQRAVLAHPHDALLNRQDAAALVPVVNGEVRLLVHVERAADIINVLKLRDEFPALKLVLVGAAEGWMVTDRIAAANVPVIASALNDLPEAFEKTAATQSNIGRMKRAGVTVAIGQINDSDAHKLHYAPQYAGNLVALQRVPGATGLTWGEAFATISSGPAQALGVDAQLGSLQPGRQGDVVIWDGDPLELSSTPVAVMIDGVQQSLDNRQARLRDRYRTPQEGALPKAYER
ncbi:amidohydrolase family protein [Blastomonas sp.]|uniref:amidohydrolase family protein n=1 Tax=Blastomonas sp. TaxID=1909299 RepID=UPI0035942BC0